MTKFKVVLIAFNFLIFIGFYSYSIYQKEKTLKEGELVLFELAPVDPRSLMQGDYMQLDYALLRSFAKDKLNKRGVFYVQMNDAGIATKIEVLPKDFKVSASQKIIKYYSNNRNINIGASSYFFEETTAAKYGKAKFGGLKIDENGNSILIGLYDEKMIFLK